MNVQRLPKEYQSKLTNIQYTRSNWIIGLPIGLNPNDVSPPCYISIACTNVDIQYEDGILSLVPPEPLAISDIIQFLTTLSVHQFPPAPPLHIAYTIRNAIQFLCELARIPVPT